MIAEVHGRKQDALTSLKSGDVLADFDNLSSNIAAENVRKFDSRQSFAHPDIKMIHRAGFDTNQHLIFAEPWVGDIFVAKNFGPAEFVNANGSH
jgi:hypothetical protein